MARLLPILLLLAAAGAASPATRGAESPAMGPLTEALLLGRDGAWEGSAEGGDYRLTNATDANAVKPLAIDPRGQGWRGSIAVEFKLESEEQALGGLLYGLQPEPLSYFAVIVERDGVALYARSPGGLEKIAAFDEARLQPGAFNELRIDEDEGQFHIAINGARIGSASSDVAGTGAVGIIAAGRGTFVFRNFLLTPAP